jgi:hypothetical protein
MTSKEKEFYLVSKLFRYKNNSINIKSNTLGNGSIVVRDNIFDANNVIVTGLGNPILIGHNLSGSINTINSQVKIKNFIIQNSQSEDAINLISSNSYLENVTFMNNSSDALDIDFGSINFKNINDVPLDIMYWSIVFRKNNIFPTQKTLINLINRIKHYQEFPHKLIDTQKIQLTKDKLLTLKQQKDKLLIYL